MCLKNQVIRHNVFERAYKNLTKYLNELKDEQKTDNYKYKTVVCNQINGPDREIKSFLLVIISAAYILKLLPRGTHEYAKLIRPAKLAA